MEIKINRLDKIKDIVEEVIDNRLEILDRASTHEEYNTLNSTKGSILKAFNDSIIFDKVRLDKYFSDHPFKTMYKNWGSTAGVIMSCDFYNDELAFMSTINSYQYRFDYNYKTKEFNFPKTGRKNNDEIQEYFRRKVSAIAIELIEYL